MSQKLRVQGFFFRVYPAGLIVGINLSYHVVIHAKNSQNLNKLLTNKWRISLPDKSCLYQSIPTDYS